VSASVSTVIYGTCIVCGLLDPTKQENFIITFIIIIINIIIHRLIYFDSRCLVKEIAVYYTSSLRPSICL